MDDQIHRDLLEAGEFVRGQCFCGALDHRPNSEQCWETPKCYLCGMCEDWHKRSEKRHAFVSRLDSAK